MNEIFGIPMSTIMIVLLVLLSLCLLSVAWVAWRRPVIFKLGVRNIPRRQAESTLIVVGLDPARLEAFGGLTATNGDPIDLTTIGDGAVVLSERAADALEARARDAI